jgi:hypothetical protein
LELFLLRFGSTLEDSIAWNVDVRMLFMAYYSMVELEIIAYTRNGIDPTRGRNLSRMIRI